jgi:hypothetical protein
MNRTARAVMLTQMLCAALLATTSFGYDIDDKGILLRNAKWDYIDTAGRVVIEPQFEGASPFFEGVAHVEENNNETGHWGDVDTAGRPAFANKRVSAPFRNGRAWAQIFNPATTTSVVGRRGSAVQNPNDFSGCGRKGALARSVLNRSATVIFVEAHASG